MTIADAFTSLLKYCSLHARHPCPLAVWVITGCRAGHRCIHTVSQLKKYAMVSDFTTLMGNVHAVQQRLTSDTFHTTRGLEHIKRDAGGELAAALTFIPATACVQWHQVGLHTADGRALPVQSEALQVRRWVLGRCVVTYMLYLSLLASGNGAGK